MEKLLENIKIVALFMGDAETSINDLNYDSDWNCLMAVVKKILDLAAEIDEMEGYYLITDAMPYIDQTFEACVNFIKQYGDK